MDMNKMDDLNEFNNHLNRYHLAIEIEEDRDGVLRFNLYSIVVDKLLVSTAYTYSEIEDYALRCIGSITIYGRIK